MTLPSEWIVRFAREVRKGATVLDVACGSGRHSILFRDLGARVTCVDRDVSGLADTVGLEVIEADLENGTPWPLGKRKFECVVVTNYLWRPILPDILNAVAPDGYLLYETFALGNETYGRPSRPDFLLKPGELLDAVRGKFEVRAYEHGYTDLPSPRMHQRICAVRNDLNSE